MEKNATDQKLGQQLVEFVMLLLVVLDEKLDKWLVRTFLRTLQAMVALRHNRYGLLLSELGGYILNRDKHQRDKTIE